MAEQSQTGRLQRIQAVEAHQQCSRIVQQRFGYSVGETSTCMDLYKWVIFYFFFVLLTVDGSNSKLSAQSTIFNCEHDWLTIFYWQRNSWSWRKMRWRTLLAWPATNEFHDTRDTQPATGAPSWEKVCLGNVTTHIKVIVNDVIRKSI